MGFVIAFPAGIRARNRQNAGKRPATAEITIFPGVRYERLEPRKRDKPGHQRRFFDKMPQPG